jgi:carbonic anhydrase
MGHGKFATAVNCMDGRTQLPVNEWMCRRYGIQFVDTITEPGPVRLLAAASDAPALESLRRRVAISVERHGSRHIAIVAHEDCAGNPLPRESQLAQLAAAYRTVASWGLPATIDLLWLGGDWSVELISAPD